MYYQWCNECSAKNREVIGHMPKHFHRYPCLYLPISVVITSMIFNTMLPVTRRTSNGVYSCTFIFILMRVENGTILVSLVEQDMLTFREHLISVFSECISAHLY